MDAVLGSPGGRWIGRHIHMNDSTPVVNEHDENEQDSERGCRYHKEVDRRK
jgi:hypothetical protein